MEKAPGRAFGVLWDFDGVIADTKELHFRAWNRVLGDTGIGFDWKMFVDAFGMINAEALPFWFHSPLPARFIDDLSAKKEKLFLAEAVKEAKLLPGVGTWLRRLQGEGVPQAVASSAPLENIEALVDALAIRPYFTAMVSASAMPGKPDPAVFLEAARRISVPAVRCVVVEDSHHGITAARSAGMRCIAVATTHPLDSLSADIVVENLETLQGDAFRALAG